MNFYHNVNQIYLVIKKILLLNKKKKVDSPKFVEPDQLNSKEDLPKETVQKIIQSCTPISPKFTKERTIEEQRKAHQKLNLFYITLLIK